MRESKAYFLFFKKNAVYFLIGSLLFTTLGTLVQFQKPIQYKSSILLEINTPAPETSNQLNLIQEAVTLARSQNIQANIGVNSQLTVFNNSPLTIAVESLSRDKNLTLADLAKVSQFLKTKFNLEQLGMTQTTAIYPNLFAGALFGLAVGNFLVLIIILIFNYFKKY